MKQSGCESDSRRAKCGENPAGAQQKMKFNINFVWKFRRAAAILSVFALGACSIFDRGELPPRGEALIVVDTNLPVPRVASRLRIDVFTDDGRWIATRDEARPDPRDWPTSFSVYTDDEARPHVLLVRLRA